MAAIGKIPTIGPKSPVEMAELINEELADIYVGLGDRLLINSDFRINQRVAATRDVEGYFVDRWRIRPATGGVSMTAALGAPITDDAEVSFEFQRPTAGLITDILEQRIEDVRRLSGKRVMVAFDVVSDEVDPIDFGFDIVQNYGTGGSAETSTADTVLNAPVSATRIISVVDVPSVSGKTIGANSYSSLRLFRGASQVDGTMRIGNVDMRVIPSGLTPTDARYAPPDPGVELLRAQRYFWRLDSSLNSFAIVGTGVVDLVDRVALYLKYPVAMRAIPVTSTSALSAFQSLGAVFSNTPDAVAADGQSNHQTIIFYTKAATFPNVGDPVYVRAFNTALMAINFDAEL